jgi:hypothetical protein
MLPPIHNLLSFAVKCKLVLSRLHKYDNFTAKKTFIFSVCLLHFSYMCRFGFRELVSSHVYVFLF